MSGRDIVTLIAVVGIGALFIWFAYGLDSILSDQFVATFPPKPAQQPVREPCLDCIEYGAPYDGPCDACGFYTPYRRPPTQGAIVP